MDLFSRAQHVGRETDDNFSSVWGFTEEEQLAVAAAFNPRAMVGSGSPKPVDFEAAEMLRDWGWMNIHCQFRSWKFHLCVCFLGHTPGQMCLYCAVDIARCSPTS